MSEPFYAEGLRFSCARCSSCCRGGPGYVFLSQADLRRLLGRLGLDFPKFFAAYCTLVDTGQGMALSLAERPNYDCILWSPSGCSVYEDRPVQCSTYPFWQPIINTPESWEDEASSCPGVGTGELRSRSYIEGCLYARREAGTIVLSYGVDPERCDEDTILGSAGLGPNTPHAIEGQEQDLVDGAEDQP
jgi:Predicted Fe-S-cluster oxidoreductase